MQLILAWLSPSSLTSDLIGNNFAVAYCSFLKSKFRSEGKPQTSPALHATRQAHKESWDVVAWILKLFQLVYERGFSPNMFDSLPVVPH